MNNGAAALALSVSTINSLVQLGVMTREQARDTVDNALKAVAAEEREATKALIKQVIPELVR